MMYRFKLEEGNISYGDPKASSKDELHWKTQTEIQTGSKKQLAALLRGIAEELDPPEKVFR